MRTRIGVLLVTIIMAVSLYLPARPVEQELLHHIVEIRAQSLALLGLPIVITRTHSQSNTSIHAPTTIATPAPADPILWVLEYADIVSVQPSRSHTTVPKLTPTLRQPTVSDTPTTVSDTPTTVSGTPTTVSDTPTTVSDTPTTVSDTPTTVSDTPTLTVIPTTTIALLSQDILDGFRSKMPAAGFWAGHHADIHVAVTSFQYAPQLYSVLPRPRQRFVTCTLEIRNNRDATGVPLYVDATYITLVDLEGRRISPHTVTSDLPQPFGATIIASGQQNTGQLAFEIGQYTAPAQLIVAYANKDAALSRATVEIELRVWPIVQ